MGRNREERRREREERKARREAREHGYEYRPGAARDADFSRRLERGFGMLDETEDTDGDGNKGAQAETSF